MRILICLLLSTAPVLAQTAHRVSLDGSADFTDIQSALDAAVDRDTVLVAPGEYVITEPIDFNRQHDPDNPDSPVVKNLVLRSEAGADETTIRMSETPDDPERTSVVVFKNGETGASELEGFRLTGAAAGSPLTFGFSGGLLCVGGGSPKLTSCEISGNDGAGVTCAQSASPVLSDCTIRGNRAEQGGGLLCVGDSSPTLVGCVISDNTADRGGGVCCFGNSSATLVRCAITGNAADEETGGGVCCFDSSSITIISCTVTGNAADSDGGGVYGEQSSTLTLQSCTVVGNTAGFGAGVGGRPGSSLSLTNCVVWGNESDSFDEFLDPQVKFSCIEGESPWPGEGNINDDPIFVRVGSFDFGRYSADGTPDFIVDLGNYRLQPGSPCVDSGSSIGALAVDIEGNPRFCGGAVDMGAYESQTEGCTPVFRQFVRGNANAQGDLDTADVTLTLSYLFLGEAAPPCLDAADTNDDGSLDVADPVAQLFFSFLGGAQPPSPFPLCGTDATEDELGCESFPVCPD